jgi:tetratricopeptide (TPR) repeat protein
MEELPFTAKVVKKSGDRIYLNAGSLLNVKPGDRFFAYSRGEEFIDPDTGLSLGSEETPAGIIEVKDVKDKFSIAVLVSGDSSLKRGDVIKEGQDIKRFPIPESARSSFRQGESLFSEKDYKGSEQAYRQAVAKAPDFALGYNNLGSSLTWQGRWEESIDYYRRAAQLEPNAASFHRNLANALYETNKLEEAQTEYEAVLSLNPNDKEVRKKMLLLSGKILLNKKNYPGAEAEYRKALEKLPDSALASNQLGVVLYRQGKWEEAATHYRRAIELKPNEALYHSNLGETIRNTGNFKKALPEYETAVSLNPSDKKAKEKAALLKIILLEDKGDVKGAELAFKEALTVMPSEAKILFVLDILRASRVKATAPMNEYGWLGIEVIFFGLKEIEKYRELNVRNIPGNDVHGIHVVGVSSGSAAKKAELRAGMLKSAAKGKNPEDFETVGDIIIKIDGQEALGNFFSYMATKQPGEKVVLEIIRDGEPLITEVTLGPRPN